MRQEQVLSILREEGPCTVGEIAERHFPGSYNQGKVEVTLCITRLKRYGLVHHVGFRKGIKGVAKLWSADPASK